ncbi:pentatricopeptide repeat-containing protein At2g13420, mitochondrial-like [Cucurbita maxima]|uniref:Pentatricopeptide repeat-containing protein At2g13420, mitochondrial-like n=1 Tax=Cucurbita maxima TaxID=3661 RepID=A0A6J1HXQ0_CUCMA|nr:pentatricopeptide repeat-containing protein At2g13420, mitochondrial-like [Cucurbita maxima]XP_022967780.1 pentatricopeptide repeat-containing protein At2g13420, mitochondrial-like [Cucurbita maxima]
MAYRNLHGCKLKFPLSSTISSLRSLSSLLPQIEASRDADLVSQVLVHHHNPFHAMESSLQLHSISFSSHLLDQTLLRLTHHSKIALSLFHYAKSLPFNPLSTSSYNILIDILAKVRQFDAAWHLILQMDHKGTDTFLLLIRRLISAGLTRQAVRAFDDIEGLTGNKVRTDEFCYLLDTLCKYGYVKVAAEVFNKRKAEFGVDVKIYTVLIYGWCKIGRFEMGERFLKDMIGRGIEPNVVTYNVLLNGVCRRASLHPEGRFEQTIRTAEKVFDEMRQRGIDPDVTSFSIVLHVYSRAHKPELSFDKLKQMKELGISPTVATYTSVIKCLCSCGRLEEAENLVGEMVRNGISPSPATYNCFFKEYRGRKDGAGALRLYKKMREDCLCAAPSLHTYNILLGLFLNLDKKETLKEVWNDMKESGIGPDLDSYTTMIHGLCEKQRWREACQFFVEMIERGFLPQKVTFEMLYRGLIQSDMLRTWRRLKKKLEEESITYGSEFKNYHIKPYRR